MKLKYGIHLPELLERGSAGEVVKANSNLSICIKFTVFSFLMAYNNKIVSVSMKWCVNEDTEEVC